MQLQVAQRRTIAAQGTGGKQSVVGGHYEIGAWLDECRDGNESRLGLHIVTAEEVDAIKFVVRDEAFDFVEHRERIKRAQFGLEAVSCEPDSVAVGFT